MHELFITIGLSFGALYLILAEVSTTHSHILSTALGG